MNKLIKCDALTGLTDVPNESIPLVVTSPPWGKTRNYGRHEFDFEPIASELWRVVEPGGIVCWEYKDQVEDGSLSCEHCHQLIYFQWLGFRVYEDITVVSHNYRAPYRRHYPLVSHVYVLAKGKPEAVQRLYIAKNKNAGAVMRMNFKDPDGYVTRRMHRVTGKIGYRGNVWEYDEDDGEKVWEYSVGWALSCEDRETFKSRHGAIMPWQLAFDLIRTYSRPGKLVLDVCGGTGTTGVAALMTGRKYLLFEPWDEAVYHARRRLANMARKLGTPQPPKCESSQVSEPTPPHADSGDDAPNDG